MGLFHGRVGKITAAVGTVNPLTTDLTGALRTTVGPGKYQAATLDGRVFAASNQAAVAITAAFATTYTGLVLENPASSGKNITLLQFSWATTVAVPTATAIGLMTGLDAGDAATGITPRNRLVGTGNATIAVVDDGASLTGTPVLEAVYASAWTEATTAGTLQPPNVVDLNGSLILPPGSYVAAYSTAANTAAFVFSFMWEEQTV